MRKRTGSPAGIGVITIFTILIILCMAVFSALTLSSARADFRLSQSRADAAAQWYAADAKAVQLAEQFAVSDEAELETTVPISESRELYLHLLRASDGTVTVLAWQTRALESSWEEHGPDLWDGSAPQSNSEGES